MATCTECGTMIHGRHAPGCIFYYDNTPTTTRDSAMTNNPTDACEVQRYDTDMGGYLEPNERGQWVLFEDFLKLAR